MSPRTAPVLTTRCFSRTRRLWRSAETGSWCPPRSKGWRPGTPVTGSSAMIDAHRQATLERPGDPRTRGRGSASFAPSPGADLSAIDSPTHRAPPLAPRDGHAARDARRALRLRVRASYGCDNPDGERGNGQTGNGCHDVHKQPPQRHRRGWLMRSYTAGKKGKNQLPGPLTSFRESYESAWNGLGNRPAKL